MWNFILGLGKSVYKLRCFLHNGKVSREAGIKYCVKTYLLQGTNHLLAYTGTRFHAKFLAQRNLGSWCCLYYNMLAIIINSCQYILNITLFSNSTGRTGNGALTAAYTGHFILQWQWVIAINAHNILTGLYTLTTQNTLLIISLDRWVILANGHTAFQVYREVAFSLILIRYPSLGS